MRKANVTNFSSGGREGYSLVEVSLALLVIGLGLVAVFGLFPEGLRSVRRSVDDAETAAFAQFVFASLEYEAGCTDCDWGDVGAGLFLMRSHALDTNFANQPYVTVAAEGTAASNYWWVPNFYAGSDWALFSYKVAQFRYKLVIGETTGSAKFARLEVWPGASAGTAPSGPGKVFYREYVPAK